MEIKNNKRIIIELSILFALFYLPGYLFQNSISDPAIFNSPLFNFRLWTVYIPQISLILYLIHLDKQKNFEDFGIIKPKLTDIPYIAITIAALILIIGVILLLFTLFPFPFNPEEDFLWDFHNSGAIPFILITSILTGYSEEIFFRSYLFTRLEQLQFNRIQILFTINIIFSIGHFYEGIQGGIIAFILGFFFSLVFIWKKNINIPAIVHALYNFSVLMLCYFVS
ncbi:MAG: CPBP family intramembrane metalloprotease [Deltaproteobacteria bacterium]|nr:CPBP family intramembrane metalloprotease [Deltaproteobacteria bacterium]